MSMSDAGSSASIARISPTAIRVNASRALTIGMGQNRPVQSICLSGLKSLDSATIDGYPTSAVGAASRKAPARRIVTRGEKFPHHPDPEAAIFWRPVTHAPAPQSRPRYTRGPPHQAQDPGRNHAHRVPADAGGGLSGLQLRLAAPRRAGSGARPAVDDRDAGRHRPAHGGRLLHALGPGDLGG